MKLLKTIHLLALAAFLGSILGYIVSGEVAAGLPPPALAVSRQLVLAGTDYLTLPALLLLILSGVALAGWQRRHAWRWLAMKLAGAGLLALLALWWIRPAIVWSLAALHAGTVPALEQAMQQEAVAGAANLLLTLLLIWLAQAAWRYRAAAHAVRSRKA